jgi:hypothetical protein
MAKLDLKTATLLPALLLSTACAADRGPAYQTGQREPISMRDDNDACGFSLVQNYVGLRANGTVREEVTRRSGAATVRWLAPGMAATMDFRADRLNALLDQDGVVVSLSCG